jgi:hypothetical protein
LATLRMSYVLLSNCYLNFSILSSPSYFATNSQVNLRLNDF